jgi:hypothetical protein
MMFPRGFCECEFKRRAQRRASDMRSTRGRGASRAWACHYYNKSHAKETKDNRKGNEVSAYAKVSGLRS